jgi:hypothetical protein
LEILKNDDAAQLARQQANEALETNSGKKFGYNPEKSAAENKDALQKMEAWVKENTKQKGASSAAAG